MTDNMELKYNDIMVALFKCFPKEHIEYCFGECYPISPTTFVNYVSFEFIKHAYFESLEKHPLRYYIGYSIDDISHSERMRYARVNKYVQKYKKLNYDILFEKYKMWPDKRKELDVLLSKDMSNIKNRIDGYELTEMEMFEYTNIMELQVIKSITEHRLYSSKKVSNSKFVEILSEYDKWVKELIHRSKKNAEEMMFSTMAFFTLEWKYSLEFVYLVADYMEKAQITDVDFYTLWAFALPLTFSSRLGNTIFGDNRMVKERQNLIKDFFVEGKANSEIEWYRTKYVEIVGLSILFNNMTSIDGGLYKDWFKENTDMEDWASFAEEYNIFDAWHEKNWTNKKIQNARKILKLISPVKVDDVGKK